MTWPTQHFTADDLDAFHSASSSPQSLQHLEECPDCRALVEKDRAVLGMLEALAPLSPRADLADRVLAQVTRPVPVAAPARRRRPLALAASLVVALGTSVLWSLFNRALLASWLDRGAAALRDVVWDSVATLTQNLLEQTWLDAVRQFGSSSGRVALAGGVLVVGYTLSMIALRRLLIHPAPAVNPKW
jgi:hypothetical protein